MGPQHPSTHGVLRLVVSLKGEMVQNVEPHIGYIHRGIEKMCENLTYPQIIHLTDRMDYLSAHINNEAVCLAVEKALGIEVSDRVKYISTITERADKDPVAPAFLGHLRDGPGRTDLLLLRPERPRKGA